MLKELNSLVRQHLPSSLWRAIGISCCLLPATLWAQPNLIVDNNVYPVTYSGGYEDFTVPGNAARIILELKGGDGGKARAKYDDGAAVQNTCNANGGVGASLTATFNVGNGPGKIPVGSIIRFIVGGVGTNGDRTSAGFAIAAGGGGGATGILFKAPGASSFSPLAIAGAGGGAYSGATAALCDNSTGRGGNYGANGDNGGGVFAAGDGGTGGQGGGGNELLGGGGGGYLSDGDGTTCVGLTCCFGVNTNEAGEGHLATDVGSEPGQSEGCSSFGGGRNGGFGYGSGGLGADVGGGGGGYSGGGKGGSTGAGGGGGSYVNSIRLSESGSDGGSTGSPANGTASYRVIPRPDNDLCSGARLLTCGSSSSGSNQYASGDDKPSPCATGGNYEGVWFKFAGTGDVINLNTVGSNFDASINVYTGSCGAFACLGGDEDAAGSNQASYSFCTVVGTTYYAYLDGFNGAVGNYQLNLTCSYTPPTLNCPTNFSKNTDPNQCSAITTYNPVAPNDNCGLLATYRIGGPPSGGLFPKGATVVTWETIDGAGQTASCSFTVTVVDAQAPTMVCPNITRPTDLGQCGAVVTYGPTITENCPGAVLTVTEGLPSGSFFPKGSSTVKLKVTDGAGLMSNCVFTVQVTDTELPAISCPANISKVTDAGLCTAVVSYATPVYSDNCPGAVLALQSGGASGTAFAKGATVVKWRATDAVSLFKECMFTVTVTDGQAPGITCPQNLTRNTGPGACSASVSYATPTATDNCGPAPILMWVSGGSTPTASGANSVSTFQKGSTTVTWKATDGANLIKTCTFRVTINDLEVPTPTCPANQSFNVAGATCASFPISYPVIATDNCPSPAPVLTRVSGPASGALFPKGVNTVVWRATDASGNSKTCSFTVTITDNVAPTIVCPASINATGTIVDGACVAVVAYANATATDNCAVTSTVLINGLASYSVFPQGVTTNIWQATDDSGLTSTCTFNVTVSCPTTPSGTTNALREAKKEWSNTHPGLHLTPNPASTNVTISLEGFNTTGAELNILDALGRVAWRQTLEAEQTQITVDLSAFSTGAYWVSAKNDGQIVTKRLIVQQ